MSIDPIGVLGASNFVGAQVLSNLGDAPVFAWSRRAHDVRPGQAQWRVLGIDKPAGPVPIWISVAPIWVLAEHFAMMEATGARRVVALSSTTIFTRTESGDAQEIEIARLLNSGEEVFRNWAEARGIEWVILRPTLIYGDGGDKNISEVARFIGRFGFFPLFGGGHGLRQPVRSREVAAACIAASRAPASRNKIYTITGGETLAFRQMVRGVFTAMGRMPVTPSLPLPLIRAATALIRALPAYRNWSATTAERMSTDMVFTHDDARDDFGYAPGPFHVDLSDLPKECRPG